MQIARRWEMIFMIFSGVMIVYTLRVNMSVAAQKMRDDLGWTESQKGLVLSSFYWGYALGQIPASRLCQIYGAKWMFGLSVLVPSILTLFVPVAARTSFGAALFIRCIIGFFESASFPCMYHFIPIWIPLSEKTFMIPAVSSGMYMGTIVGFSLSGALVESNFSIGGTFLGGWQSVFYVFGAFGIVWFPYWAMFAYETPEKHPRITAEEVLFINKGKHKKPMREIDALSASLLKHDEYATGSQKDDAFIAAGAVTATSDAVHIRNALHASRDLDVEKHAAAYAGDDEDEPDSMLIGNDQRTFSNTEERTMERSISMISDDGHGLERAARTPWKQILTHPASLTLLFNNFVFGWIGFTLLSEMPAYLTDVLGFDLESAGILSVFPYLVLFFASLGFGKMFDYFQAHYGWEVRTVRQVAEFLSLGGAALGLLICGFLPNRYAAYTFMIITQFFFGAAICGLSCAYSDCSPNYSPIMNTIGNTIGAVAGIAGPLVIAVLIEEHPGVWGWRIAFMLTVLLAAIALVLWYFFQRSDIVPELNTPKKK